MAVGYLAGAQGFPNFYRRAMMASIYTSLGEPSPDDVHSPLNDHEAYLKLKRAHNRSRLCANIVVFSLFALSALLPKWVFAPLWFALLLRYEVLIDPPERLVESLGWPVYLKLMQRSGEIPSADLFHGRAVGSTTWV
jgi:hypothetical protein